MTGLLKLEPESALVLDGEEWTVRLIEAHRGRVLLRAADGQEEWRTIRWLACHRGCRAAAPCPSGWACGQAAAGLG